MTGGNRSRIGSIVHLQVQNSRLLCPDSERSTYMNMGDRQVNVVQKFIMVLDRVTRGEEHHDFLVSVFLQEGKQNEKTLL